MPYDETQMMAPPIAARPAKTAMPCPMFFHSGPSSPQHMNATTAKKTIPMTAYVTMRQLYASQDAACWGALGG